MKIQVWSEERTDKEGKDCAYWERNMLAALCCFMLNEWADERGVKTNAGWYMHGEWPGWNRVISFWDGAVTFHIPDDFDVGDLPRIEPNWDGHTTEEKWRYLMDMMGMEVTEQ